MSTLRKLPKQPGKVMSLHRALLIFSGLICVALGALGMILPVLPTVPFLLVALWCFARSSQRFHDWLYHHRLFGPSLQRWQQHRVIPIYAKTIALLSMIVSAAYVIGYTNTSLIIILLMLAVMIYGAYFILTKPSRPLSASQQ